MYIDSNPKIQREHIEHPEPIEHDDLLEPLVLIDGPRDIAVSKKRPLWVRSTIQDAEKFVAPSGTFKESKRPQKLSNYVSMMCNIIEAEPEAMNQ